MTGTTRQPAEFNRVVCFVDGSPDGLEALRQAATLRAPDGELVGVVPLDLGLAAMSCSGGSSFRTNPLAPARSASEERAAGCVRTAWIRDRSTI